MEEKQVLMGMIAPNARKRVESYKNISNLLAESGNAVKWSGCMSSTETKKAFTNLKNDLNSQNEEEVYEAAGACIHLLANQSFLSLVDTSCQKSLCDILVKILKPNKERKLMNRILQSLAKSRFSKEVYVNNLMENFDTLSGLLQTVDLPVALIIEVLQVVIVLFNATPLASVEFAESWFPSTFSKLFHTNFRVRKVAVIVVSKIGEALNKMSNDAARNKLLSTVLGDLKNKYCKDMVRILVSSHFDILQVWRTVVTLLDTQLHTKRALINSLLHVVEKAFKVTNPEVRVDAFLCWRTIIDNFALVKDTISHTRKLQLLIAPFKIINAKTEDVSNTKLLTWWHFVCVLSDRNCLAPNFDLVVVPLLHFCFTNGPTPEGNKGGISNRNLIMSGALSSPGRAFSSLHHTCAEILAQLLATEDDIPNCTFSVQAVGEHIMSSVLFLRHYPLFMKCFSEAIQTLNFSDAQQKTLGIFLFHSLLTHVKAISAPDVQKKEAVDVVRELFNTLSHIESHCEPGNSESHFLFEFYNILTIGSLALPKKIFNSHQYHIASSGGGGARDVMCGTLSNHLVTQLCSPALLHHTLTDHRFFTLWETVLENSQPVTGKLRFLEATIQEMSASAIPFLCPEHPLVMCHLWGMVLKKMLAHIEKTKTVETDEGEPDWSCIYSVLHFPIIHATEAFSCTQSTIYEEIMELWRRLWKTFILFARATPTVEPNIEVEQVASTLFALCQMKGIEEPPDVSAPMYFLVVEVLALLTETFCYSKLGKGPLELSPSPAKAKRKPHPLHNLGTCVELTAVVFERVCVMVTRQRNHMADKICQASTNMMEGILEAPMKYVQQFIVHIGKILSKCVRVNPAVVFDFHVEQRFVDMLGCFTELIEAYITQEGVTESVLEHLNALESLFTVALTSTNNKVKLEVYKLLNVSISSITVVGLEVPSLLLDVQRKWDQTRVSDQESIEDFIEATPKGRLSIKSVKLQEKSRSCRSKKSTPKSNTSSATMKMDQVDKNKDRNTSAASAAVSSGQVAVKVRKVELRKSRNKSLPSSSPPVDGAASPTPSDAASVSANEDSSEGMGTSTAVDNSPIVRVVRTKKGANAEQNREGQHTVESQEKEKNNTKVDVGTAPAGKPLGSIEPVVSLSILPENIPEDSDKTNRLKRGTHTKMNIESTTLKKSVRQKSGKNNQNNSINHSKDAGNETLDSSTVFLKGEPSPSISHGITKDKSDKEGEPKVQRFSKSNVGKADEDLVAVLHDASFEMQRLLKDRSIDNELECPNYVMNTPSDQGTSPHKKPQTDCNKAVEKTPQADNSIRSRRINFMEVIVSPSVVKDAKIVEQHPKVEISMNKASQTTVLESDSEDEIPSSLEVNNSVSRNSTYLSEKSSSENIQSKEKLPVKCREDEPIKCRTYDGSSTAGKRKRKLFDGDEHLSGSRKKRNKTETSTQDHSCNSSLDESVIDLIDSSHEECPTANTKESAADNTQHSTTKKTRKGSVSEMKAGSTNVEGGPANKNRESSAKETKGGLSIDSREGLTKESEEWCIKDNKGSLMGDIKACLRKESKGEREETKYGSSRQTKEEPTQESQEASTKETKEGPTEETEQVSTKTTKDMKEGLVQDTFKRVPKANKRTRSCPGHNSTETEEKNKTKSAFSPKVTRSGRKIVPPNRDMPEPMTPPKKSKRRLHQKDTSEAEKGSSEGSGMDFVDSGNSASNFDENRVSLSVRGDSETEYEMEMDNQTTESSMQKGHKERLEHMEDKTSEMEYCFDDGISIIDNSDEITSVKEGKRNEAQHSNILSSMRRGASALKPSEFQKDISSKSLAYCVEGEDSSGTVTVSSGDSVQELVVNRTDNRKNVNQNLNIADQKSALHENKQGSHASVDEGTSNDTESNSSEPDKSKSDKPMTEKDEHQSHKVVEKGGGLDQSEDSLDQQKTSDESTPMECGQTLVEEVTYPGSSRGAEALDDIGWDETLCKDGETVSQGRDEETVKLQYRDDEDGKEMGVRDVARNLPASSTESDSDEELEEEEDGESPCEDDHVKEIEGRDSPFSPDLEVEEEEECISAGHEIEKKEEEKTERGTVSIADRKQQETTCQELQEREEGRDKTDREKETSDKTDNTRDQKISVLEVNSRKIIGLSSEEEISAVSKHSEMKETDAPGSESQDDLVKDGIDLGEEMENINEAAVSKDVQEVKDANTTPCTEEKEKSKTQGKDDEEPQTTLNRSQDKLQEESAISSKDVRRDREVTEAFSVAEASCEVDRSLPKDVPELSVDNSALGKGSKEESQIAPGKKQSRSENTDMEIETNEQESSDGLRRESQANKTSSDSTFVQAEEAARSYNENIISAETDMSSERTDNINGTVSSPRKTVQVIAAPRRTVQVKETATKLKKPGHNKETVPSPNQTAQALDTTPIGRDSEPIENSIVVSMVKAEEQGESDPKVLQLTEKAATEAASEVVTGTSTSMATEASEEPAVSSRQQEEELSPDKSSRSRLKLTVSTPERLKHRGTLMHAGSRAALLVACAKQNIKNRSGGETESPSGVLTESGRSRSLGSSPTRRSVPNKPSPGHSPDSRRRSHLDNLEMRPWMKHSPSPGASPSTSILKRTLLSDGPEGDIPSPPPTKYRRVSFADPPVSERVEIPPSPRTLRGIRAQKRLDMTRMASPTKDSDAQPAENQGMSQEEDPKELDWVNPIYPALLACQDKVEQVAQHLTSPAMLPGLLRVLEQRDVYTVGQLSKMTELAISSLPIKVPKVANVRRVLRDFEKTQPREMSLISTPVMDEVEQSLAKMFGELDRDDKENRRPNQQDCMADPLVEAEGGVRESSGRASHSDNIQEIMEMEDITPLDSAVDVKETESEALRTLYRRASEEDLDSQKRLLHHLLHTLPPRDVADAIAECIKARMDEPASSPPPATTTTTTTTASTSTT